MTITRELKWIDKENYKSSYPRHILRLLWNIRLSSHSSKYFSVCVYVYLSLVQTPTYNVWSCKYLQILLKNPIFFFSTRYISAIFVRFDITWYDNWEERSSQLFRRGGLKSRMIRQLFYGVLLCVAYGRNINYSTQVDFKFMFNLL